MVIEIDYENATISCCHCGHVNIFNRATDLPNIDFIVGVELPCKKCSRLVSIPLETASPAYELFVFDSRRLQAERKYMQAVAAVAQAFEMYFAFGSEVMLLFHPWHATGRSLKGEFYRTEELLFELTKQWTYRRMRNLFTRLAIRERPCTFTVSQQIISEGNALGKDMPDDEIVQARPEIATLLLQLKGFPLDSLRNKVLHKRAYRPTESEAQACIDPANRLLSDLWVGLALSGSLRGTPNS